MTRRHLVDQYAPNLSARLGALSLEQRRRVLAESCTAMSERVPGLDPALRSLVDAAVEHDADAAYELCMLDDAAGVAIALIEAAIVRQKAS